MPSDREMEYDLLLNKDLTWSKLKFIWFIFTPSATAVVRRGIVVAMSVRPPHFQLSLTAKVSGAFFQYCMVMVPSNRNLRLYAQMSTILNSKWPTPKSSKNTFYIAFFSVSVSFTWNAYHLIFAARGEYIS